MKGVAVGDRDLALGVARLRAFEKKGSFAFLSANILDSDQKPVFSPSIVVDLAGVKVGVIGATTALFYNKDERQNADRILVQPAAPAVAAEATRLAANGVKFVVLLGHLNPSEVEECIDAAPQIGLVLGGQWLEFDQLLRSHKGVLIAGAFQRGKNVSVLDAYVKNDSWKFVDRDARAALEGKKRELEAQILGRQKMIDSSKNDPSQADTVKFFEQNLVQLKTDLQEATLDLEDLTAPDPKASFVRWRLAPMDASLADDPTVQKSIDKHREKYPDPSKPVPPGGAARAVRKAPGH